MNRANRIYSTKRIGNAGRVLRRASTLFLVLLLVAGGSAAGAERAANLLGYVKDTASGRAVVGATVSLEAVNSSVMTNGLGFFAFRDVPVGVHFLVIEALGYEGRRVQVRLTSSESFETEIWLGPDPIDVEGLDVTVMPRKTFTDLADLSVRLERGSGQFLLRDEMEERGGNLITLLQGRAGVRVTGGGGVTADRAIILRGAAHLTSSAAGVHEIESCYPAIFVDGRRFSRRASLGDQATDLTGFMAGELETVEVYSGASVPAIFGGGDAACGAILVWTRRGPQRRIGG